MRVCGVCYDVYQCLDWARNLLNKKFQFPDETISHSSHKRSKSSVDSINSADELRKDSVVSAITFNESGIQDIPLDQSVRSGENSASRGGSVKRGRRQPVVRSSSSAAPNKATWKTQLENSTSPERRQIKRSEIAVLDNYIR